MHTKMVYCPCVPGAAKSEMYNASLHGCCRIEVDRAVIMRGYNTLRMQTIACIIET